MFGKWVEISFGLDFEIKVWVSCTPDAPYSELLYQAMEKLSLRVDQSNTSNRISDEIFENHKSVSTTLKHYKK